MTKDFSTELAVTSYGRAYIPLQCCVHVEIAELGPLQKIKTRICTASAVQRPSLTAANRPRPAGHRPPERSSEIKEVAVQWLAPGHPPRGRTDNGRRGVRSRSHAGRDLCPRKPRACLN